MSQIGNLTQFDPAAASAAYQNALRVIGAVEPTVANAIGQELADQRSSLKLIASENYASPAVLLTMGQWMSDKYAEGTIGHRFYAGCQNIDIVEQAAADHAKALFGAPHAYVQPHSGIDANLVGERAVRCRLGDAAQVVRRAAHARHVAGCRRAPDARIPAQHLGQDVPPDLLRDEPRDRTAGL
jgi:glycine hydroxymethyltransferase